MQQYRLNNTEAAYWRRNNLVIQDKLTGEILRSCTQEEREQAAAVKSTNGSYPTVMVGDRECVLSREREILMAELLQKHGECMLKWPNGVFIKSVKDPRIKRPSYSDSISTIPAPDMCACKATGAPHPGRHHPTCTYNAKAPIPHRAKKEDYARMASEVTKLEMPLNAAKPQVKAPEVPIAPLNFPKLPKPAGLLDEARKIRANSPAAPKPANMAAVIQTQGVPHPKDCPCKDYGTYNPDPGRQHNQYCQYFSVWMQAHPLQNGYSLVRMEDDKVIREATELEIAKARQDEANALTIDRVVYYVRSADGSPLLPEDEEKTEDDADELENTLHRMALAKADEESDTLPPGADVSSDDDNGDEGDRSHEPAN